MSWLLMPLLSRKPRYGDVLAGGVGIRLTEVAVAWKQKETVMTPEIDAQLKQLADELPDIRRQHPDDFWDVFHARAETITAKADSTEQAAQIVKRIDEMLAAHQLGPADPGA